VLTTQGYRQCHNDGYEPLFFL